MLFVLVATICIAQNEKPNTTNTTDSTQAETQAACPALLQTQPLTRAGFAKAMLVALWYARNAVVDALNESSEASEADPLTQVTAWMRGTKMSTNSFLCAKRVVRPFTAKAVGEHHINTAAQVLLILFDEHIALNDRLLKTLKNLGTAKPADWMDEVSTIQVERGKKYNDLTNPAMVALMLLVDTEHPDREGHASRLIITKAERKDLLDWANEHFPEFTNGKPEKDWAPPATIAHGYFTLSKFTCSDE
jgi:hypothetical protein